MFNERTAIVDCAFGRTSMGVFIHAGGRLQLLDYATVAHRPESTREAEWLAETGAAFAPLRRALGGVPVTLVFPAGLVLTKYARLPAVAPAKREKILRFEATQGIPLPLDEVVWDAAPLESGAAATEAVICAAKRQQVEALCEAAEGAGLSVRHLVPAPLAAAAAAEGSLPAKGPQAVISASRHALSVALRTGEGWRVRSGPLPLPADATAGEVAARLGAEFTRTVLHFQTGRAAETPRELFITGAFAADQAVLTELAARTRLPVQAFDALRGVETSRAAAAAGVAAEAAQLTELIGAAQLGSGSVPAVNLLPQRLRTTEAQRRRRPWWAAAAALALLALLPPYLHFRGLHAATRGKIAAIETELAPLREREARIRHLLEELAAARATQQRLQVLHERRDAWVGLLADLQERLARVEDVWFDSMKVSAVAEPGGEGCRITVSGRLLDKTNPRAQVSREASARVRTLIADLNASPFVTVGSEKFNDAQAGILQFNFVLVPRAARPL